MYLDAILEVAIGLVFTWLVLSIATMQVEEWISGWCRWRAQLLEKSIKRMLNNESLVQDLYHHPSIAALSKPGVKPSYIPSDRFAQTLFDVVFNQAEDERKPINGKTLRDIKGIGEDTEKRLKEIGINTIEQLAKIDEKELEAIVNDRYRNLVKQYNVIQQAKKMSGLDK